MVRQHSTSCTLCALLARQLSLADLTFSVQRSTFNAGVGEQVRLMLSVNISRDDQKRAHFRLCDTCDDDNYTLDTRTPPRWPWDVCDPSNDDDVSLLQAAATQ